MTDAINKNSESQPEPENTENTVEIADTPKKTPKQRRIWLWVLIILLSGTGAGLAYAWFFIQRQLAPKVEESLSQAFNRPIELGSVERFTLQGLRFGPSQIPPTQSDPDRLSLEALDVAFDPLLLLFRTTLKLDLTLIKANAYIEQDENNNWIGTKFAAQEPGKITIDLQSVRVQDARISLVPRSLEGNLESPVQLIVEDGRTNIAKDSGKTDFRMEGQLVPILADATVIEEETQKETTPQVPPPPTPKTEAKPKEEDSAAAVEGSKSEATEQPKEEDSAAAVEESKSEATEQPKEEDSAAAVEKSKSEATEQPKEAGSAAAVEESKSEATEQPKEADTEGNGSVPPTPSAKNNKFALVGTNSIKEGKFNLTLSGKNLDAVSLSRLGTQLPLQVQEGTVGGYLEIALQGGQLPSIKGNANLENLTVNLEQLPQPFSKTTAQLEFKGQQLEIKELSTLFGVIPAQATGIVDLEQGLDLNAQIEAFQIEEVLASLKIKEKLPLELAGELKGSLKITGAATNPKMSAEFISTKEVLADKLKVKDLVASLSFIDSALLINKIEANPIIGGKLTGTGQIKLEQNQQDLVLEVKAKELPGSGIAQAYFGIKPYQEIGPVSAGITILGNLQEPENLTATGSASLKLANGNVIVKKLKLEQGRWEIALDTKGVELAKLLPQLPEKLAGPINGAFLIKGNLNDLKNLNVEGINAIGTAELVTADGGKVQITDLQIVNGDWLAAIALTNLQLGKLSSSFPAQLKEPINGTMKLNGSLATLTALDKLTATGTGELALGEGKVIANASLTEGQWEAKINVNDISLKGELFSGIPSQLTDSVAKGEFSAKGNLENLTKKAIEVKGRGELTLGDGKIVANVDLVEGKWETEIIANSIKLDKTLLPGIPEQLLNSVTNGTLAAQGNIDNLTLAAIEATGTGKLTRGKGKIVANVHLVEGTWQAAIKANGINLENFAPQLGGRTHGARGSLIMEGTLDDFSFQSLNVSDGTATVNLGSGTVTASNFSLANGQWQGQVSSAGVKLEELLQQDWGLPGTIINGTVAISGNGPNFNLEAIALSGEATIALAGGTLKAQKIQLDRGQFATEVTAEGIELQPLVNIVAAKGVQLQPTATLLISSPLGHTKGEALKRQETEPEFLFNQGRLAGAINFSGNLANLNPQAMKLSAQFQVEESKQQDAVALDLNWNGQRLNILEAKAGDQLQAKGFADLEWTNSGTFKQIKQFDFDLKAKKIPLETLPIPFPEEVQQYLRHSNVPILAGNGGFEGNIAGTPAVPQVNGDIELENFTVAGLAFDEMVSGKVQFNPGEESKLELIGVAEKKTLYPINLV